MSVGLRQALLIGVGGVVTSVIIVWLARRQLLTLRYTLGWLIIGGIAILGALLTPLVDPVGRLFGMSPTGVLLAMATGILLAITLQLSISVSLLQSNIRVLAEENALLTRRVEELHQESLGA